MAIQQKKRVEFTFFAPGAKQVLLSGSFNKWSEKSDPMKQDHSGTWKKIKVLAKGKKHQYKFIVDGEWKLDPDCSATSLNQDGTLNNVIDI